MEYSETNRKIAVVIVAAGRGQRSGLSTPKQYVRLGGKTVLEWSIEAFQAALPGATIQVVIGEHDIANFRDAVARLPALSEPVIGGASRQESVLRGLQAIEPENPDIVLIHDAARPFVSASLIERVTANIVADVGVVPALPVSDTLRKSAESVLGETIDRNGLQAMQTPQGFPFIQILQAHISAVANGEEDLTDDAEVFRKSGRKVMCVIGERNNIKLTHQEDFEHAERFMTSGHETRTGQGFDVHAFAEGDAVTLCGVRLPHTRGLKGHSDADVGLHALTDAVLGAIADGDIGHHFPPSDPQWKGAASDLFVREALKRLRARHGRLLNIDLTLICEEPRIGPHRDEMRANIASLCDIELDRVSVKATTSERLGFTGRGEGIAALAIATISLPVSP